MTALPQAMFHHGQLDAWSDKFRSALLRFLQSVDIFVLTDFLDALQMGPAVDTTGQPLPDEDCLRLITTKYAPADVFGAWRVSLQWATTVRCLRLVDVTKQATDWRGDLTLLVSYWLLEHSTASEVEQLATAVGHPEACRYFFAGEIDTEAMLRRLAAHVRPHELATAWDGIQPGPLTSGTVASWHHLRQTHTQRARWHTLDGQELLRRLNALRTRGANCQHLADQLDLTAATIYNLTTTPPERQHIRSAA